MEKLSLLQLWRHNGYKPTRVMGPWPERKIWTMFGIAPTTKLAMAWPECEERMHMLDPNKEMWMMYHNILT